jgi:parvulin-like peptidyl-prolyl isomerase
MLIATLCIQASLLAHPLYVQEEQPELRSAQHILLLHDDMEGQPFEQGRTREEALELMKDLRRLIEEGEDFGGLAREFSNARTSASYGSLGSFPPGMLKEPFNGFLYGAEMGELSEIFDLPSGLHLLKRVEPHAAILQIQLEGTSEENRELAASLMAQLRAGADFGDLARKHSSDTGSAARGGQYRVFERGSNDSLLKLEAFRTAQGEIGGPLESPLGLHLIKRVEPSSLPRDLWEDNFIRARGILVSHLNAVGADPDLNRTQSEAKALADEVIQRVEGGESFAEIAARFNDDPGGKERAGDLGWIHRQNPDLPIFFSGLFVAKPGTMSPAHLTSAGVVVLIREK